MSDSDDPSPLRELSQCLKPRPSHYETWLLNKVYTTAHWLCVLYAFKQPNAMNTDCHMTCVWSMLKRKTRTDNI